MTIPTLGLLPVFCSLLSGSSRFAAAWLVASLLADAACSIEGSVPCQFISGGFLQNSREALLDRLGRLGCDLLNEVPEFLVLCGRDFKVLSALRG